MTRGSTGARAGASFDSERYETSVERNDAPSPSFPLLDEMFVEPGSIQDWLVLHDLHYKAEKLPMGPRFWKATLYGETIGVLVTGVPKLLVRERHLVMPHLKPCGKDTRLTNTQRANWLNRNLRVVSRFVFDTMYRGVGAGYRMMNLASRMEGPSYMEIQSSMSKFNLFGQKAGFRFAPPLNANNFDTGMRFFRGHFDANPADSEALMLELQSKPAYERDKLIDACRYFYRQNSALENTGTNRRGHGNQRVDLMTPIELIKAIQQMALASPLYGVFRNPDKGRDIPRRLPLSAFDLQKPNEPLNLDALRRET